MKSTISVAKLSKMSKEQLDELFKSHSPGEIPIGDTYGRAIIVPGTKFDKILATFIRWFIWQGKHFDPVTGTLRNKVSIFSIRAIKADVYKDKSWMDGKETIVLDYSKTSFVAQKVRDEIREVEPGLYLGKAYWGQKRLIDFTLVPAKPKYWLSRFFSAILILLVAGVVYFSLRFT